MNFDDIIITSLVRYGEADCIARVLTREHGRLSLFCRGGLKPSKRRGSMIQTPARGRAAFKLKEGAGLSTLSELDLGSYTSTLASNLRSFSLSAYACEITEIFVPEHDLAPLIFETLDAFLNLAATTEITTKDIRHFEFKLLEICGLLSEEVAHETDPRKMADIFAWHLKQHKQTPLKSLAFFKQIGTKVP
ncbi:MAG: DNA repair protein RecO [Myxococcota bacterium]